MEISSTQVIRSDLLSFYIHPASAASGAAIKELPFPQGAAATMIVRGDELIPPRGDTALQPGDHVYVFCRPEDRALVLLMFGQEEEE